LCIQILKVILANICINLGEEKVYYNNDVDELRGNGITSLEL
jgi:hypothetical protein